MLFKAHKKRQACEGRRAAGETVRSVVDSKRMVVQSRLKVKFLQCVENNNKRSTAAEGGPRSTPTTGCCYCEPTGEAIAYRQWGRPNKK